ncbi:MAG: tetratricopeptide repeat protein, partial [Deltaproteobacteria bacterium]|nr:tetratricopeptide repeat protein [Deltaproteobacteria bacterium]
MGVRSRLPPSSVHRRTTLLPAQLLLLALALAPPAAARAEAGAPRPGSKAAREQQRLIEELYVQIKKVDRSIGVTKELIKHAEKKSYLPDLLFRLAELHAEKSRYLFLIEAERQGGSRMVVSPEAKLVKERASSYYWEILEEFPRYPYGDRVLFFAAHEQRELGQYEEMRKTYQRLIDEHPASSYQAEARLILGDYCFDLADLAAAEGYYGQILAQPESHVHQMARYKLAWIRINQEKMKEALELFHRIVQDAGRDRGGEGPSATEKEKLVDLRREALVDMVFVYTEVKEPEAALAFFEPLTESRAELALVLDKLGNRYFVQQKWGPAATIYRRLAEVAFDAERLVEYVQRIARCVEESGDRSSTDRDLTLLARAFRRYRDDWRFPEEQQQAVAGELELLARDAVTRLHEEAQRASNRGNLAVAVSAYRTYLDTFPASPHTAQLRMNLAEASFDAGRYLEAGQAHEQVAAGLAQGAEREESLYAAIVAYHKALEASEQLSPLALRRA